MRERAMAALRALQARVQVDAARIGAQGYCFGGGVASNWRGRMHRSQAWFRCMAASTLPV
jgi:dienelactone hydrolase